MLQISNKFTKSLISTLASSLIISSSFAGDGSIMKKSFGGEDRDIAYSVTATNDGGFVSVGLCESFGAGKSDVCAAKMSSRGKLLWKKALGGKRKDFAKDIIETKDGNLLIVGNSKSFGSSGNEDIYSIMLNKDGNTIWTNTYGGDKKDFANAVVESKDGNFIIAGETKSYGNGRKDGYLIKIDKNGKMIWSKSFGGKNDDYLNDLSILDNQDILVTGSTKSYGSGGSDIYILRLNSKGKQLWAKAIGEKKDDIGNAINATIDGGAIIVGQSKSYGSKKCDVIAIRLDKDGRIIWNKLYGSNKKDRAYDVFNLHGNEFLVAGMTDSFGNGEDDFYILKLDKLGGMTWSETYGSRDDEVAYKIAKLKNGSFIIAGETESYGAGDEDFFIVNLK